MKKILFFILLIPAISTFAQDFHYGVKIGGNYSFFDLSGNVKKDIAYDLTGKFNIEAGIMAEYSINKKIGLSVEINYDNLGDRFYKTADQTSFETKYNLTYIEVPLIFKYYIIPNLSINVGGQAGSLLSAENKFKLTIEDVDSSDSSDAKSDYESLDYGLNLGVGFKLKNGMLIDIRFYQGLKNINKLNDAVEMKNSALKLGIGYYFK